jgi:hypothetical protein
MVTTDAHVVHRRDTHVSAHDSGSDTAYTYCSRVSTLNINRLTAATDMLSQTLAERSLHLARHQTKGGTETIVRA